MSVSASGHELVSYRLAHFEAGRAPQAAVEPPLPVDVSSTEELYLTGLHLAQYHHATRHAEDYWEEALRRQPEDARSNTAMGWSCLHRGEFRVAIDHFERAVTTLTRLNPNPRDGEPLYGLGLALRYANRLDEADDALAKAAWSAAWYTSAQFARAQLAARRGQMDTAIGLLDNVVGDDRNQLAARAFGPPFAGTSAGWRRHGPISRRCCPSTRWTRWRWTSAVGWPPMPNGPAKVMSR